MKSYCGSCGSSNPGGMEKCRTCGSMCATPSRKNPITSADFANPKLAVFDIDDTLLDPTERFRSGVRAGIVNKEGGPVKKGAWKERDQFIYREDMLAKDKMIPNAMDLIEYLMREGYTIAYCTNRPFTNYGVTKNQLESKGFPIFKAPNGDALLFMKKNRGQNAVGYKVDAIRSLQSQYDVRLFFDDKPEMLQGVAKAGVPGVYPSVKAYWDMIGGSRTNPDAHQADRYGGQYVTGTDDPMIATSTMIDPDSEDEQTVGATSGWKATIAEKAGKVKQSIQQTLDEFGKNNPAKRGKDSKGHYYRWGGGQKYYYKPGNKASRERARKKAYKQAQAAFASGYEKNPFVPGVGFVGWSSEEEQRRAAEASGVKDVYGTEAMFKSGGKVDYDNYLPDIDDDN